MVTWSLPCTVGFKNTDTSKKVAKKNVDKCQKARLYTHNYKHASYLSNFFSAISNNPSNSKRQLISTGAYIFELTVPATTSKLNFTGRLKSK